MWYVEGVGVVKSPRGLTLNGITYPRKIFTHWNTTELAAIGITPYRENIVNDRYYISGALTIDSSGPEAVGTVATIDRDVAELKKQMKRDINAHTAAVLLLSDWMHIREGDGGTAMHADWKTYRAAVRTTSNTKDAEVDALADTIAACKTYEEATPLGSGWPAESA